MKVYNLYINPSLMIMTSVGSAAGNRHKRGVAANVDDSKAQTSWHKRTATDTRTTKYYQNVDVKLVLPSDRKTKALPDQGTCNSYILSFGAYDSKDNLIGELKDVKEQFRRTSVTPLKRSNLNYVNCTFEP